MPDPNLPGGYGCDDDPEAMAGAPVPDPWDELNLDGGDDDGNLDPGSVPGQFA